MARGRRQGQALASWRRWSKMSGGCQYWTYVRREGGLTDAPRWLTAFLVLLQGPWSTRRDAHIRFLKLQVEMLKARRLGEKSSLAILAQVLCSRELDGLFDIRLANVAGFGMNRQQQEVKVLS